MMSLEVDPPELVKTNVYRPDLDLRWRWGDPGTHLTKLLRKKSICNTVLFYIIFYLVINKTSEIETKRFFLC
jgi:hypothetical protein